MNFLKRRALSALMFFAISVFIFLGYNLFIEYGTSKVPTKISLTNLSLNPPKNRNLIITNSICDVDHTIKYWENIRDQSTIEYYIPLKESNLFQKAQVPKAILKISSKNWDNIENGNIEFDPNNIPCFRLTQLDLNSKAQDKLEEYFGSTVENMIIVEYMRKPKGMEIFILSILMGIGLIYLVMNPPGKPPS